MESFSKKYKIIPFMLIFMTPLVSILYNVLKLVPEIKKMTAPYAPVFSFIQSIMGYFHHFSYKNDDTGLEKCT